MTIDASKYRSTGPGKFEGEPPETQYYWEQYLNGDGDTRYKRNEVEDIDEGMPYTFFTVDAEESDAFELECGATVVLWEDSQGFVCSRVFDHEQNAVDFINGH